MRISRLAVLTSVLLASAAPVFAQTPPASAPPKPAPVASDRLARGDFDAGADIATWVRNQGTTTTYKGGWHAGGSYRIRRVISVVAEATGDYRSAGGHTANIYTYGGGVRFQSGRKDLRIRPFAKAILGGGQDNGDGSIHTTNHYPILTPGGGLDLGVSHGAAIRVSLDFPLLMTTADPLTGQSSAGHTLKCTRVAIGVAFPLGSR